MFDNILSKSLSCLPLFYRDVVYKKKTKESEVGSYIKMIEVDMYSTKMYSVKNNTNPITKYNL